jgi:hypothetical protein
MLCRLSLVRTDVSEQLLRTVRRLLVTANVPSSPILVTLIMEVLSSSKSSILTRITWHNIPQDRFFTTDNTHISLLVCRLTNFCLHYSRKPRWNGQSLPLCLKNILKLLYSCWWWAHVHQSSLQNWSQKQTNSLAFSPQANYTTERLPLFDET